ncbi:MAG: tRNA (cytidine(56)-2'-O)-methyltransferase [Candidatus Aenigmatarchaeota archaeon]
MVLWVLRIGHRLPRDERISTHCGLVARAFGCDGIIFSGEEDLGLLKSIKKVVEKWGGNFEAIYEKNWKSVIKKFRDKGFIIILLTMYGVNLPDIIEKIKEKDILIIIGSEKVPTEVYDMCDLQIAVGNQPHSEVAAIAVFLDRYFEGKELKKKFNGKVSIIPKERGKCVLKV